MAGKGVLLVCIFILEIQRSLSQDNTSVPYGTPTPFAPNTGVGVCTCDLTPSSCDVNCCCDEQCNELDRAAFSSCVDIIDRFNSHMCMVTDIFFTNNLPSSAQLTTDGQFCIANDNFQSRSSYTVPDAIDKDVLYKDFKKHYKAFSFTPTNHFVTISGQEYKAGSPVLTLSDSGILSEFGIPRPALSNECSPNGAVTYLYDDSYECSRAVTDLQALCVENSVVNVKKYFKGFSVLANPSLFGQVQTDDISALSIPSNRLLKIQPTTKPTCYNELGVKVSCSYGNVSYIPSPAYDSNTRTCQNVLTELQYVIYHQGRGGIFRVDLDYTLKTITESHLPLTHKSKIQFSKFVDSSVTSSTPPPKFVRSGNPGYIIGRPVLAGKKLTDSVISLSQDSDEWFNLLKSTAIGDCITETVLNKNRQPVLFGINMRSGCLIRLTLANMTMCDSVQRVILSVLEGQTFPDYVGSFGNSAADNITDWVSILSDSQPTGARSSGKGVCTGMVMGMHIEIVYANIGSLVNPQPKIIGVRKLYEEPQTLRYQCTQPQCSPNQSDYSQPFEVTTSVSYIDVSLPNVIVSANVPPEQAKLPRSFFWPFYFTSTASHEYSQVILFVATLTLIWSSIL